MKTVQSRLRPSARLTCSDPGGTGTCLTEAKLTRSEGKGQLIVSIQSGACTYMSVGQFSFEIQLGAGAEVAHGGPETLLSTADWTVST